MIHRYIVLTAILFSCMTGQAWASEPLAYHFGGRMGLYHQSYMLDKAPLETPDTFKVTVRRIHNTGRSQTQENEVVCTPANPSVTGKWGEFKGKVFDDGFEVSGASEDVYNLLWAVCRGETFKSFGSGRIYEGYHEVPVAEDKVKGETYQVHIRSQDAIDPFWAVRKVTLEYRRGKTRVRKTAHVFCDPQVPTVTVDGKTHELAGKLLGETAGTWENVWTATCVGRNRLEREN